MGVNHCPTEVLDSIFAFTEEPSHSQHLPHFPLWHLSLVCRRWNPIAERRLYRAVSIESPFSSFADYYDRRTSRDLDLSHVPQARTSTLIFESFLWTLKHGRVCLRDTICEVRLRSLFLTAIGCDHFIRLFDALRLCHNVAHFELHISYVNVTSTEQFSMELGRLVGSLQLKSIDVRFDGNKACLSANDLFGLVPFWPELESFKFHDNTTQPATGTSTLAIPLCKRTLRELSLCADNINLNGLALRALRNMTHVGVESLEIQVANDEDAHIALFDCLKSWGRTLQHLKLVTSVDFETTPFPSLLSHLVALRSLHLDIHRCDIDKLFKLPFVEVLDLGMNTRKMHTLVNHFSNSQPFPLLRKLRIRVVDRGLGDAQEVPPGTNLRDAVTLLRTVCLSRRIDIEINGCKVGDQDL